MNVLTLSVSVCNLHASSYRVWSIDNPNMSHKTLPMAIFKPFGYSSSRTVLQITCFWCWLALGCGLHLYKWRKSANINKLYPRVSVTTEEKKLESSSEESDCVPEGTAYLSSKQSSEIQESAPSDIENPSPAAADEDQNKESGEVDNC